MALKILYFSTKSGFLILYILLILIWYENFYEMSIYTFQFAIILIIIVY